MAKGKWDKWISEEGLVRIRGWARDGLTDAQIAENMRIGVRTFYEWKERFPHFAQALKEDKDYCDRQVENALYQAALAGNTTAMIFWLKNRRPQQWRERREEENADKTVTIHIEGCDAYGD